MLRKIVAVWILTQVLAVWGLGCADGSHPATRSPEAAPVRAAREAATPPTAEPWDGVYASPSEIGGFSGTVLALDSTAGFLRDRMRFYTDVRDADAIDEPVKSGSPLVEGDHLYVPEASGYTREGKISLLASVTRYTRLMINGRTVLMRDDALDAYQSHNRLYDYGILIKSKEEPEPWGPLDLEKVKHESIRILYQDPNAPWHDPFVNGPNPR